MIEVPYGPELLIQVGPGAVTHHICVIGKGSGSNRDRVRGGGIDARYYALRFNHHQIMSRAACPVIIVREEIKEAA